MCDRLHMKKGERYSGYTERTDFPNKGVVRIEGTDEYAAVKNALPGQRILFSVSRRRGGKTEGRLLEVLEEAECCWGVSRCPHSGSCGGCLFQGYPYEETLRIKEEQVKRLLSEYIKDAVYEGMQESPLKEGYRNKMEYTFGDEYMDGPLALGLHKKGSFYDIVNVPQCRIAPADFGLIIDRSREFFAEKKVAHYHRLRHTGILRHLLLRRTAADGSILAALVTSSEFRGSALVSEWAGELLKLPLRGSFAGILHIINDSPADAVKCDELTVLHGEGRLREKILGLGFDISTFSFFQTNSLGAERLYTMARDFLAGALKGGTVYDLYCGTGTISQVLSPAAGKVIGVEIVEEAVEAARVNAGLNGIDNCSFICGDVLKVLDEIEEKPEVIVLDPPRDGVHPKALKKILDYGVDKILYISCKASSLARDMEAVYAAGYRISRWGITDMFPMAAGMETCCLLEKTCGRE